MKSKIEIAKCLAEKIWHYGVQDEVLSLLLEKSKEQLYPFEMLYTTGERSYLLKSDAVKKNLIVGVIVGDYVIALRDGALQCNWRKAKTYCMLSQKIGRSVDLFASDLDVSSIFIALNEQFEKIGGEALHCAWYWTNLELTHHTALALNPATNQKKVSDKCQYLRFRPCCKLSDAIACLNHKEILGKSESIIPSGRISTC